MSSYEEMAKLSKEEIEKYILDEVCEMISFAEDCKSAGDCRSSGEICEQWIKNHAEEFRISWLLEHKNK